MFSILGITFPIFAAIAIGYGLVRFGFFKADQVGLLSKYVINIALPPMIFNAVVSRSLSEVIYLPFMGAMLIGAALTMGLTYLWFLRTGPVRRMVGVMGAAIPNSAFIGFPLMMLLFPGEAGVILSMNLIIENVILIPLMLSLVEVALGAEGGAKVDLKKVFLGVLKRPMIIGLLLGLAGSVVGLQVPGPVDRLLTIFASSASAVSLLVIGGSLAGLSTHGNKAMAGQITAIKMILHPAMVALAAFGLVAIGVPFEDHFFTAAILSAAMPSFAIYTVMVSATKYGGLASLALLFGTVASFFTVNTLLFLVI